MSKKKKKRSQPNNLKILKFKIGIRLTLSFGFNILILYNFFKNVQEFILFYFNSNNSNITFMYFKLFAHINGKLYNIFHKIRKTL